LLIGFIVLYTKFCFSSDFSPINHDFKLDPVCKERLASSGVIKGATYLSPDQVYNLSEPPRIGGQLIRYQRMLSNYSESLQTINEQLEDPFSPIMEYLSKCKENKSYCHSYFFPKNRDWMTGEQKDFYLEVYCDGQIANHVFMSMISDRIQKINLCSNQEVSSISQGLLDDLNQGEAPFEMPQEYKAVFAKLKKVYNPSCFEHEEVDGESVLINKLPGLQTDMAYLINELENYIEMVGRKINKESVMPEATEHMVTKIKEAFRGHFTKSRQLEIFKFYESFQMFDVFGSCCEGVELIPEFQKSKELLQLQSEYIKSNLQKTSPDHGVVFFTKDFISEKIFKLVEGAYWKRYFEERFVAEIPFADLQEYLRFIDKNPFYLEESFEDYIQSIKLNGRQNMLTLAVADHDLVDSQFQAYQKKRNYKPTDTDMVVGASFKDYFGDFGFKRKESKKYNAYVKSNATVVDPKVTFEKSARKDTENMMAFSPAHKASIKHEVQQEEADREQSALHKYRKKIYPKIFRGMLPYAFMKVQVFKLKQHITSLSLDEVEELRFFETPHEFTVFSYAYICRDLDNPFCNNPEHRKFIKTYLNKTYNQGYFAQEKQYFEIEKTMRRLFHASQGDFFTKDMAVDKGLFMLLSKTLLFQDSPLFQEAIDDRVLSQSLEKIHRQFFKNKNPSTFFKDISIEDRAMYSQDLVDKINISTRGINKFCFENAPKILRTQEDLQEAEKKHGDMFQGLLSGFYGIEHIQDLLKSDSFYQALGGFNVTGAFQTCMAEKAVFGLDNEVKNYFRSLTYVDSHASHNFIPGGVFVPSNKLIDAEITLADLKKIQQNMARLIEKEEELLKQVHGYSSSKFREIESFLEQSSAFRIMGFFEFVMDHPNQLYAKYICMLLEQGSQKERSRRLHWQVGTWTAFGASFFFLWWAQPVKAGVGAMGSSTSSIFKTVMTGLAMTNVGLISTYRELNQTYKKQNDITVAGLAEHLKLVDGLDLFENYSDQQKEHALMIMSAIGLDIAFVGIGFIPLKSGFLKAKQILFENMELTTKRMEIDRAVSCLRGKGLSVRLPQSMRSVLVQNLPPKDFKKVVERVYAYSGNQVDFNAFIKRILKPHMGDVSDNFLRFPALSKAARALEDVVISSPLTATSKNKVARAGTPTPKRLSAKKPGRLTTKVGKIAETISDTKTSISKLWNKSWHRIYSLELKYYQKMPWVHKKRLIKEKNLAEIHNMQRTYRPGALTSEEKKRLSKFKHFELNHAGFIVKKISEESEELFLSALDDTISKRAKEYYLKEKNLRLEYKNNKDFSRAKKTLKLQYLDVWKQVDHFQSSYLGDLLSEADRRLLKSVFKAKQIKLNDPTKLKDFLKALKYYNKTGNQLILRRVDEIMHVSEYVRLKGLSKTASLIKEIKNKMRWADDDLKHVFKEIESEYVGLLNADKMMGQLNSIVANQARADGLLPSIEHIIKDSQKLSVKKTINKDIVTKFYEEDLKGYDLVINKLRNYHQGLVKNKTQHSSKSLRNLSFKRIANKMDQNILGPQSSKEGFKQTLIRSFGRAKSLKMSHMECALPNSLANKEASQSYVYLAMAIDAGSSINSFLRSSADENIDFKLLSRGAYDILMGISVSYIKAKIFTSKIQGHAPKMMLDYAAGSFIGSGLNILAFDPLTTNFWRTSEMELDKFEAQLYEADNLRKSYRDFFAKAVGGEDVPEVIALFDQTLDVLEAKWERIKKDFGEQGLADMTEEEMQDLFLSRGLIKSIFEGNDYWQEEDDELYMQMFKDGYIDENFFVIPETSDEMKDKIHSVIANVDYQMRYANNRPKALNTVGGVELMDISHWKGIQAGNVHHKKELGLESAWYDPISIHMIDEWGLRPETVDRVLFYTAHYDPIKTPIRYTKNRLIYYALCNMRFGNPSVGYALGLTLGYNLVNDPIMYSLRFGLTSG